MSKFSEIKNQQLKRALAELRYKLCGVGSVEGQGFSLLDGLEESRVISSIREKIDSELNRSGEFYKIYFDTNPTSEELMRFCNDILKFESFPKKSPEEEVVTALSKLEWVNPAGNNLLLLAVSRGAFSTNHESLGSVYNIVHEMISDARTKLDDKEFKKFISFGFCDDSGCAYEGYFNNPLTLAAMSGMYDVVNELIDCGSDLQFMSYGGRYNIAHILALRIPFSTRVDEDIKILSKVLGLDESLSESWDGFGRSLKDLIKKKNEDLESIKLVRFGERAKEIADQYKLKLGTYSFNELKQSASDFYRDHIEGKGFVEAVIKLRSLEGVFCHCPNIECTALDLDLRVLSYDTSLLEKISHGYVSMLLKMESPDFAKCTSTELHDFASEFRDADIYSEVCSLLGGSGE